MMDILAPLIMFDGGNFTEKVEQIYQKCDTHSIKVDLSGDIFDRK